MVTVKIQRGHVQPLWAGHPWVFAQAIAEIEGAPAAGDVVRVMDPRGNFLGKGYYSPGSALPVRILSRDPSATLDAAWLNANDRYDVRLPIRCVAAAEPTWRRHRAARRHRADGGCRASDRRCALTQVENDVCLSLKKHNRTPRASSRGASR